jgi:hypothetical protein
MKKKIFLVSLCLGVFVSILAAWLAYGAAAPTKVEQTIGGGYGHYTSTLAREQTGDVTDGTTVATNGVSAMDFAMWDDNGGTVSLTPQCGYYVYVNGARAETKWADLDTVAGAAAGTVLHYELMCDLVRVKAASCSGCRWTAVWKGYVR